MLKMTEAVMHLPFHIVHGLIDAFEAGHRWNLEGRHSDSGHAYGRDFHGFDLVCIHLVFLALAVGAFDLFTDPIVALSFGSALGGVLVSLAIGTSRTGER